MPSGINPGQMLTLTLLTAVPMLSLNMFLPSLGDMAGEFQVGYDTMALAVSVFLVATAVIQLLSGPVADRYGRRPVLLASLVLFVAASICCAFSESFTSFLFFRVLQGAVFTGAALSRAVVSDIYSPRDAASIFGYMGMAMSLAPILGPSLGGFLGELAGWRANFWVFTGTGIGLWLLVWTLLPETADGRAGSGASFARSYLELLSSLHFWAYSLILALSIGGFFVFISGVPLVASEQMGLSQSQTGLGMATISIGFLFGNFLAGRLSAARELDTMILAGRLTASLGLLGCLAILLSGSVTPWSLFGGTAFVGIGNGLTMPAATSQVMFVRRDLAASAAGLYGAVMVVLGAAFSAITGFAMEIHSSAALLVGLMLALTLVGLAIAVWIARRHPGETVGKF